MKQLKALQRAARLAMRPYCVRVQWGRDQFKHRAATVSEALAWAELYPAGSAVWVTTRSGMLVTFRQTGRARGWLVS